MRRLTDIDQEKEKRKANRVTRILEITGAVFAAVVLLFLVFGHKFDYCEHALEIKSMEFNGVVTEKVDDTWNHNSHALKIKSNDGQETYLTLTSDANRGYSGQSRLWEQINQGDSIVKKSGDFHVRLKKVGQEWTNENLKYNLGQCNN